MDGRGRDPVDHSPKTEAEDYSWPDADWSGTHCTTEDGSRRAVEDTVATGQGDDTPPPLAESTQRERVRQGFSANETLLRTGALRDSIGWEHVSLNETVVGSTDEIAIYHELGPRNGHFPARPFISSTAGEQSADAFALYVKMFGVSFDTE